LRLPAPETLTLAFFTETLTGAVEPVNFMSASAMRPRSAPPLDVDLRCDRLKVVRVHASAISAEVVNL
jgi:hypothetical protein